MKQFCMYHPTRTAHWHCPHCRCHFCPECVVERDKGGYSRNEKVHFCPKCNGPVTWVGIANIIDPFWQRLPKIFAYPASAGPMILMTIIAFLSIVIDFQGITGLMARFVVWGVMLKYAFAALKQTAAGRLIPPAVSSKVLMDDFGEVAKQFGIIFLILFSTELVARTISPFLGISLRFLMFVSLPAMTILLLSTENFAVAVNPVYFVSLMFRIGWGYWIMCLFLLLLMGAPAVVMQMLFDMLPRKLTDFITAFAQNYYILVMYHLMGYVVLQYHEAIGYKVVHDEFEDPSENVEPFLPLDPEERLLQEVTRMVQAGNMGKAVTAIAEYKDINHTITNLMLAERFYGLLKIARQTEELVRFAPVYLDMLVKDNQKTKGVAVYNQAREIDPDFTPSSTVLMKMAGWLGDGGKPESSIRLLTQIIKHYPQDPVTPKAYFRAAQIFQDRMMNTEKSRHLIHTLIDKYPNSDVVPLARRYLETI